MKEQTDEEILDNLYYRQFRQSEQQKPLLSLYEKDTVQKKVNGETPPGLNKNGGPIFGPENS